MVSRITPTAGKELTVLEQIMGNVGRFSGPRQETNPGAPVPDQRRHLTRTASGVAETSQTALTPAGTSIFRPGVLCSSSRTFRPRIFAAHRKMRAPVPCVILTGFSAKMALIPRQFVRKKGKHRLSDANWKLQRKSPGVAAGAFVFSEVRCDQPCASTASSSRATMLVILIIGFTAGPAVSL